MAKSRYGIYTNIDESDYFYIVNNFTFYFSSDTYKQKFIKKINSFIESERQKEFLKYNINIMPSIILYIYLYKTIEKRGFRIYSYEGGNKIKLNEEIPLMCKVG